MRKFLVTVAVLLLCSFATEARAQYGGVSVRTPGASVTVGRGAILFPRLALARAFRGMGMGCGVPVASVNVGTVPMVHTTTFQHQHEDRFGDVQDLLALRDLFEDEDEDDLEKETAEIVRELVKARLVEADETDQAIEEHILGELRSALQNIDERLQALEAHSHQ